MVKWVSNNAWRMANDKGFVSLEMNGRWRHIGDLAPNLIKAINVIAWYHQWYRIKCLKLGLISTMHVFYIIHYCRLWTNIELRRSCIQEGNASFVRMSFPGTIKELRSNPHLALIEYVWQCVKWVLFYSWSICPDHRQSQCRKWAYKLQCRLPASRRCETN